ncbi:MAG: formyltransferase family protein, partial [Candidatus Peribacteraceae bacterium]|nr:formyltransferase family protein [Candidatus Peribacteraceae bacterium]
MRVILLANNRVGLEVTTFLKNQGVEIVGLIIHGEQKQKLSEEIVAASGVDVAHVFDGSKLEESMDAIKALNPDMGISLFFDYILKKEFIDIFPSGCINLHPAYLPFNRGSYPNVYAITDGTPAGATLHYIDEGIDSGDVITRKEVTIEPTDTGKTLYGKLEDACVGLFTDTWPKLVDGSAARTPQSELEVGTTHKYADAEKFD